MNLAYEAVDRRGQPVKGTIEAASATEATERLYHDGLYVTRVFRAGADRARRFTPGAQGGRDKASLRDLAGFTRQLSVLTSTGTPLVESIGAVERQLPEGPWRNVVGDLRRRLEEGETLVHAMEQHPRCFSAVFRSLVAAGESGGQLAKMLDRLSVMTRQQLKVRHSIVGALTYPAMLLVISVVVVLVMLTVVLPRFTGLFRTLDAPIPPSTQVLLAISNALIGYWWAFLIGTVGAIFGAITWARTDEGQHAIDTALVRLPVVGRFTRSLITARIARILGVLLESRVPMLDSLRLTRESASNAHYSALIARAEEYVIHGDSISAALRDSPLITPSFHEAVITAERTGQLGPILLSMAEFMDEDNEVIIRSLTSLVEPLILIVLGFVVGFVAISMFLPLFDLTSAAQQGA